MPWAYYHVTSRRNERKGGFRSGNDRERILSAVTQASRRVAETLKKNESLSQSVGDIERDLVSRA